MQIPLLAGWSGQCVKEAKLGRKLLLELPFFSKLRTGNDATSQASAATYGRAL